MLRSLASDHPLRVVAQHAGITRVANLTGLDHIGFPVVAAIRPASRNMTVSFGKGASLDQAMTSAVMECAELFFAEQPPQLIQGSFSDLKHCGAVDPRLLCSQRVHENLAQHHFDWVAGIALASGRHVLIPWEVADMDYSISARANARVLDFGATGLAAGFDREQALRHGFLEVIERDCHHRWNIADDEDKAASLVNLSSVTSGAASALLSHIEAANLLCLIWDLTRNNGIPCFLAEIVDTEDNAHTPYVQGAAADISGERALFRALAEALQVRLTYISGSRDDLDHSDYGARYRAMADNRAWIKHHLPASRDFNGCTIESQTFQDLCQAIGHETGNEIVALDLTCGVAGLHVVKVIAPGLHDMSGIEWREASRQNTRVAAQ